ATARVPRLRSISTWLSLLSVNGPILCSAQQLVPAAALERALVGGTGVDALEPRHQPRTALVEPAAGARRLEREAHLHVGRGERRPGEPLALAELAFHEVELALDVRQHIAVEHLVGDCPRDRPHEERCALLDP